MLRRTVEARIATLVPRTLVLPGQPRLRAAAVPFGIGMALAASLVLFLAPVQRVDLSEAVVAGHIRALQPGHLMDVASTDQHTVKPWFDGRPDFAPPVNDLRETGFPLTGGRLDYLEGRPVAALVYQRNKHLIDVYVWPDTGATVPSSGTRSGYNYQRWNADGMAFWAVSDLGPDELADFARLHRRS